MKYCVTTYSFSKYIKNNVCDYKKICDLTKKMGFDGIEFTDLQPALWNGEEDRIKIAEGLREYCKEIGLEIVSYTIGADVRSEKEKAVEKLKVCVDIAAALGAPTMRHDVCYALPADDHLYTYRDAIKDMAPYIRQVTDYAETKGVRTCTENHGYIFQAPERVEELILAVGSKNYGWLCDMGNFLCADCDPIKSVPIAARHAFHVHAKDFIVKSGSEPAPVGFFTTNGGKHLRGTIIGHGDVPIRNCVAALKKAGYNGYISVEFEGMEDVLPAIEAGLNFLKRVCE